MAEDEEDEEDEVLALLGGGSGREEEEEEEENEVLDPPGRKEQEEDRDTFDLVCDPTIPTITSRGESILSDREQETGGREECAIVIVTDTVANKETT